MKDNFECDTELLNNDVQKLYDYLVDYEKNINNLFSDLTELLPDEGFGGQNATLYSNLVIQDKPDYVDFGKGIRSIVDEVRDFSSDLERNVKENEDMCENEDDPYSNMSNYYWRG